MSSEPTPAMMAHALRRWASVCPATERANDFEAAADTIDRLARNSTRVESEADREDLGQLMAAVNWALHNIAGLDHAAPGLVIVRDRVNRRKDGAK